ncbi:hypothetical protein RDI58_028090 [Solanum bulbocastanum]
MRLRL